jgi:hypothetical protein
VRARALITSLLFVTLAPASASASAFDLVGVVGHAPDGVKVELRARLHDGHWTPWTHAHVGQPAWAHGATKAQFRTSRPVKGLHLRYVNVPAEAKGAVPRAGRQSAPLPLPTTNAPAPRIIPRSAWDPQNRCRPRAPSGFGRVRMAFVHHTVSLNGYSRSQAAGLVLGVCLFHRNGNGWDDIGYNFLVDRYGQVFEGRAGGLDQPVVGAQAGGFNVPSTGVSMIGNFTRVAPPKAAMSSLAKLLAWKLSIHGVPAKGRLTVVSAGGSSTGYRAGTKVTLNRISGHRDADLTECPGAALYRLLPGLRNRVATLEGAYSRMSLVAPTVSVPYGSGVALSGRLSPARGGEAVEIRELSRGRERVVARALTAADGTWTAAPAAQRSGVFRAVYLGSGDPASPGVISNVAYVAVTPVITLSAERQGSGEVAVSGTVAPARRAVTVTLYRSGKRVSAKALGAMSGSFGGTVTLPKPGNYSLVASVPADAATAAGRSQTVKLPASQQ